MKVSKLQAAHRQLNVAIRLHLLEDDPVAVLTLAGAASRVFGDLVGQTKPDRWWDRKAWEATGISKRDYMEVMRRGQNFLKHADRDANDTLEWSASDSESLMFFATLNAGEIDGISPSQQVFQLWFIALNSGIFTPGFEMAKIALEYFPGILAMSESEQRKAGAKRLLEA